MALFAVFDVVPLWAISSDVAGGLALSGEELGVLLAGAAVLQTVFTAFAMGKLPNRLGLRRSFVIGCTLAGASLVLVPFVPHVLPRHAPRGAPIALASLFYCIHTSGMLLAGTGIVGVTSNLCARHANRSGALNGMVALLEGIGKMLGPALAAPSFAAAISAWPAAGALNGAVLVFAVLAALFVAFGVAGAWLPSSVEVVDGGNAGKPHVSSMTAATARRSSTTTLTQHAASGCAEMAQPVPAATASAQAAIFGPPRQPVQLMRPSDSFRRLREEPT